jgi:hypothetical protein
MATGEEKAGECGCVAQDDREGLTEFVMIDHGEAYPNHRMTVETRVPNV